MTRGSSRPLPSSWWHPAVATGALSDVVVDLRSDDSREPIAELERMLDLHELCTGTTPDDELLLLDGALARELIG